MACYGEEKALNPVAFPALKKTMEIVGVFSPLGRCLKTSFSLALGQILARERAVLYLNLEEYSGFEELLGKSFSTNLSDLFYYVRQGNENLIHRMNGMIQTINNLDFIPPVRMPSDIRTVCWEDWERLLQEITLHTSCIKQCTQKDRHCKMKILRMLHSFSVIRTDFACTVKFIHILI